MARRTKEESQETRRTIIAAARDMFFTNGVTNTSLEQIAAAAGVTRGAIYWHFADKAALFYAMRDEVQIPLIDRSDLALVAGTDLDPLTRVAHFLDVVLDQFQGCEATQKTFQIMTFRCEYVGEFARDLDVLHGIHADLRDKLARLYRRARRLGHLREGLTPMSAASDTLIFVSGLFKVWMFDEDGSLVRNHARRLVADHVASKRAVPPAAGPTRKRVRSVQA